MRTWASNALKTNGYAMLILQKSKYTLFQNMHVCNSVFKKIYFYEKIIILFKCQRYHELNHNSSHLFHFAKQYIYIVITCFPVYKRSWKFPSLVKFTEIQHREYLRSHRSKSID